jgi:hypothetical protein
MTRLHFAIPTKRFKLIEVSFNNYHLDWQIVIIVLGFGIEITHEKYIK